MSEAAMAYVQGMPREKRAAMRSSMTAAQSWEEAGAAEAWAGQQQYQQDQQQRIRSSIAVSRHSMASSGSPSSAAGGANSGLWPGASPARGGWCVPAAAMAMAQAASAPSGHSTTAQRPPVYRAGDAVTSRGRPVHSSGGLNTQISAKSGGRASGWNAVAAHQLQSPREAAVAPRPARRQQQSRKSARSLSRSSMRTSQQKAGRAPRTRVGAPAAGTIVTPNRSVTGSQRREEIDQPVGLRMRGRIASRRRPGSAGRDLAPGPAMADESMSHAYSAQNVELRTATAVQSSAAAPQCPLHCDCKLPPGHSGFCRLHGPREEPQQAATPAPAPAASEHTVSDAAPAPVPPPRPVEARSEKKAKDAFEQEMVAWSQAQLESTETGTSDQSTRGSKRSAQRVARPSPRDCTSGQTSQVARPLDPSREGRSAQQRETVDTTVSAKLAGSSAGWTAVAARSMVEDDTNSKPKKLVRPASGRSWLASRRTAATNAGKAELSESSPTPAVRTTRRGPRAAVDHARATQASLARADVDNPEANPRPARPSSAGLNIKKKPSLRSAVMAASLGSAQSLSLEEQLKKRIAEKYRRDSPNIPTAVWLLQALQRTRVEACASNIIPARCLQDIPGVLHIPSGTMPELVQKYGPQDQKADGINGMVDYRKLIVALFPPLIGVHAVGEQPDKTVKSGGDGELAYLDYSALRSRVRAEVGGNRSRLIDVFRVAINAFAGRRLNIKALQFALLTLRIFVTPGAIKQFFGAHISNGIVSGHAVAAELMNTTTEKRTSGQKGEDTVERNATTDDALGGSVSPAVSSPESSATSSIVEAAAAKQVAAIVAAAKAKGLKRSRADQRTEIARAKAAEQGRNAATKAATDEVNDVLNKYLQLSEITKLPSTKLARKINATSPEKQQERILTATATESVDQSEKSPQVGHQVEMLQTDTAVSDKARLSVEGTRNLEQAWADQVSHRFSLAWSLKHHHSVVNPSMMEGVSDSSIQSLWKHPLTARRCACSEFTSDMLVRADITVHGGGVLKNLAEHATKEPNASGESFMSLDQVMNLISEVSRRGRTWATKHVAQARVKTATEPPDPEIPEFLQNDERSFTRLELSRRPQVPAVPEQQIESILQRAKSSQAQLFDVSRSIPDKRNEDLLPRSGNDVSRESSASSRSTGRLSPARMSVDGCAGEAQQSDEVGLDEFEMQKDREMFEWEQQMMARKEADNTNNLLGGYSSSDLSAEELDDENQTFAVSRSTNIDPRSTVQDDSDELLLRARQSVEDLREMEQLADVRRSPTCVDAQPVAEIDMNITARAELGSDPATLIAEHSDADGNLPSSPARMETQVEAEEQLSETAQKTFSIMRLSQHPVISSPNTFQLNGTIVKLPPSVSNGTSPDSSIGPRTKRLARPASAPMRTRRWIEKDVTSRVDYLGGSTDSRSDDHETGDHQEGPVANDVLLGSLWLAEKAQLDAGHTISADRVCKTVDKQRQEQEQAVAIAQAGAAALVEQQQLWEELRTKAPPDTEEEAELTDGSVSSSSLSPTPTGQTSSSTHAVSRALKPTWPNVKPGHKVQFLDLILFSSNIRAAILDVLPWPTLRRCRQLCKRMALVCCEAAAKRPQIAVLGGNTGDTPTAKVTAFDLPTATWRRLPNMSSARSNAAVCTMLDGRLLVAGGFDADGVHQSAEAFDPVTGRWIQLPPMSTGRSGCRACPTLDGTNGAIVMGGYDADLVTIASVECYDAQNNSWKAFPPLSSPRYDFSACVLPRTGYLPSQRERIVVAGGTADTSAWLKTAEVFDGNLWSVMPSMSMQRDRCGACVLPCGSVAVFGGSITKGDSTEVKVHNLRTCEMYDFVHEQWSDMPPMHAARCNFGAVAVPQLDGCVAVLGGEGGVNSRAGATAEVYHPRTKKWTVLTAMKEPRAGCGAAVLSVATWRSEIELELSEASVVARIRARVSRPKQLQDSPVRFYKSEKEAQDALYGTVSAEMGSCLAQDMLMGKRYFTGQRSGTHGEGPVMLVTATRMGGKDIMFGDGSTGTIGK